VDLDELLLRKKTRVNKTSSFMLERCLMTRCTVRAIGYKLKTLIYARFGSRPSALALVRLHHRSRRHRRRRRRYIRRRRSWRCLLTRSSLCQRTAAANKMNNVWQLSRLNDPPEMRLRHPVASTSSLATSCLEYIIAEPRTRLRFALIS